jgi:hypothetical protein
MDHLAQMLFGGNEHAYPMGTARAVRAVWAHAIAKATPVLITAEQERLLSQSEVTLVKNVSQSLGGGISVRTARATAAIRTALRETPVG